MGLLVDGVWRDQWYDTKKSGGRFERAESTFRNWVTPDGAKGPNGNDGFEAESGRYHLYVSLACPWAHRTLIFRATKRLQDVISVSVVDPLMGEYGWVFGDANGVYPGHINGALRLSDIYLKVDPKFTGRVTVPVLWDKERQTIVNNESADIIRMLNSAFDAFTDIKTDCYPTHLRNEIDEINALVYRAVNNGVYRAGFATSQDAYAEAFKELFDALDRIETRCPRIVISSVMI